jgi:hypothetical protein
VSVQPHAPRHLPLPTRAYLPVVLLALLMVAAATAATASAGKFEPPRQFQEGEKFLAEHGSKPCTVTTASESPNRWVVGYLESGDCLLRDKAKAYGLTIEGNCEAFGDFTKPAGEDSYICGFAFSQPEKKITNAGSCFWANFQDEQHKFHPSEFWSRAYEDGHYATLTDCMAGQGTEPPLARCDVYWVKPHGQLTVGAPGVLGNDSDPAGLPLRAVVDKINFGVSDHPYHLNPATGALRFTPRSTPGGKPFAAQITYHVKDSAGKTSNQTTATIFIEKSRPATKLKGCGGKGSGGSGDHGKKGKGTAKKLDPTISEEICNKRIACSEKNELFRIVKPGKQARDVGKAFMGLAKIAVPVCLGRTALDAAGAKALGAAVDEGVKFIGELSKHLLEKEWGLTLEESIFGATPYCEATELLERLAIKGLIPGLAPLAHLANVLPVYKGEGVLEQAFRSAVAWHYYFGNGALAGDFGLGIIRVDLIKRPGAYFDVCRLRASFKLRGLSNKQFNTMDIYYPDKFIGCSKGYKGK